MDITQILRDWHRANGGKAPLEAEPAEHARPAKEAEHDAVFEKLDAVPPIGDAKPRQEKKEDLTRSSTLTPQVPKKD